MVEQIFSLTKHQNGYENRKLVIQCPLKFNSAIASGDSECTQEKCAWWMINQRACAVNVSARVYGYVQSTYAKPYKP